AGVPDTPTYSWDWIDVQATLNADRSVDVVETLRVFVSAGRYTSLSWNLGPQSGIPPTNLTVREGDTQYPLVSTGVAPTASRYAQMAEPDGQRALTLTFP